MASQEELKFSPFSSTVDVSFFQELSSRKLNDWGLAADVHRPLVGRFSSAARKNESPRFSVSRASFSEAVPNSTKKMDCAAPGSLVNLNTIGEFKEYDKAKALDAIGASILAGALISIKLLLSLSKYSSEKQSCDDSFLRMLFFTLQTSGPEPLQNPQNF
jgi:hypothetical protein